MRPVSDVRKSLRMNQVIQNQAKKTLSFIGRVTPAQVVSTGFAVCNPPGIPREPGEFISGLAEFETTRCFSEATDMEAYPVRIGEGMRVASGDFDAVLLARNRLTAPLAQESLFRLGYRLLG